MNGDGPRKTFFPGESVSYGRITGRVVELKRKKDGKPFLMVQILDGPRRGERDWPNGWDVGIGDREMDCEVCHRTFRYKSAEGLPDKLPFCPHCRKNDQMDQTADPTRRATSWERRVRRRMEDKEPAK